MSQTKAELLHKLAILQKKEEELVMMIKGIDSTFQELGYRIESALDSSNNNVPMQTGIRMKGQLSFRGKEKAAEYFDLLDIDKDGHLNYEDFRGLFACHVLQPFIDPLLTSYRFTFSAVRAFSNPYGYVDAPEVQSW